MFICMISAYCLQCVNQNIIFKKIVIMLNFCYDWVVYRETYKIANSSGIIGYSGYFSIFWYIRNVHEITLIFRADACCSGQVNCSCPVISTCSNVVFVLMRIESVERDASDVADVESTVVF